MVFVEDLHNRTNRHRRIIAVEQVEIDEIDAQPRQRIVQIGADVVGSDALAIPVVVCALA